MQKATRNSVFMGAKRSRSPAGFHAAIFGAPHGTPYPGIDNRVHAGSANAFRAALAEDAAWLDHWDYDLAGPLLGNSACRIADLGNLPTKTRDGKGNRKLIEAQTRKITEAGAVPLMFGGDDSTPIPFIAGFSGSPPLTILQIDAHIDWRNERYGERFGYSSTMRRASEHPHVWRIVQAGARGLGSAREEEIAAAKQWGATSSPRAICTPTALPKFWKTSRKIQIASSPLIAMRWIPPRCKPSFTPLPAGSPIRK